MSREGKNGVSTGTPKNIQFGAGTIHKGLKYETSAWNFESSIVGATNGGNKLTITPEFYDVPVDGTVVPVKGLKKKIGETATLDVNFVELTKEIIKAATIGKDGTSSDSTYDLIESKADIAVGDYWENVAFVGKTLDGRNVIAILENALITSGLPLEGKNKEAGTTAYTFTCHADISDGDDLDVLPWKIYYPKATV